MHGQSHNWASAALVAVLFVGATAFSATYRVALTPKAELYPNGSQSYMPTYRRVIGPQIEMVYIGTSQCGWSDRPDFPRIIDGLKTRLAAAAHMRGMTFRAIAIDPEWSVEKGEKYIEKLGLFDEVSIGYNWGNSMMLKYIWNVGMTASTPVVLIYSRYVIGPDISNESARYGEKDRRLLIEEAGYHAIVAFAEQREFSILGNVPIPMRSGLPE